MAKRCWSYAPEKIGGPAGEEGRDLILRLQQGLEAAWGDGVGIAVAIPTISSMPVGGAA